MLFSRMIRRLSDHAATELFTKRFPDQETLEQISCSARDKLLCLLTLLKHELIQKKVIIFVNSIDMGFRSKLFLEQFGIKSAVLNAELPQNSHLHILECEGVESKEKSLSFFIREDGGLAMWRCFGGKCGWSGSI